MKKKAILLMLFVGSFYTCVYSDFTFSIIDSKYKLTFPDPVRRILSEDPVNYQMTSMEGSVLRGYASLNEAYYSVDMAEWDELNVLVASTELLFKPEFDGAGPAIDFMHEGLIYDESTVEVKDMTTGEVLFNPGCGWYFYDDLASFNYTDWNSGHEYQLKMEVNLQMVFESGYRSIATNMVFTDVPEPNGVILLGLAFLGLFTIRLSGGTKNRKGIKDTGVDRKALI